MPLATRRSRRSSIDIWPGFVDALAQLLMVIIFMLLVFTAGQFFLSDALSGRDQALKQWQQQVDELSQLLSFERASTAGLSGQLATAQAERDALNTRVAELAARLKAETARADEATGKLRDVDATTSVDKEKFELQLKELESLRRDLEALRMVRADLEKQIAYMSNRQDTAVLRDRSKELEARLASEREKTSIAQKEIDARDIRLRDRVDSAEKALAAEKETSRAARAQVEQLSQQLAALREQLARISAALDLSEAKVKAQQGQIVELGRRLNLALVNKVEELARYRSEFFGRLRQIIGDRPDIRVVGDRFVFQSEVLFTPGSAELGDAAKRQLAPVITALLEISSQIPNDLT